MTTSPLAKRTDVSTNGLNRSCVAESHQSSPFIKTSINALRRLHVDFKSQTYTFLPLSAIPLLLFDFFNPHRIYPSRSMAEPAGLAVGIVALAGLFNTTVECFEYIQLGRTFRTDFQTSQLKLDNARLRLSRWGKSLGLNDKDIQETASLQGCFRTEKNVKQAEALLGQILELFAEAEGVSDRYRGRKESQHSSLVVYDPQIDLDPPTAKLHERMRGLALERQNRSDVRQKAKWALYQEKQFRRLIEDITDLVDGLDKLFPAAQQAQRHLCDAEVSALTFGENGALSMLRDIAAAQDKLLEQAITKAAAENGEKSHHIVFSCGSNSGVQLGHNSGIISGLTFGRGG